MGKRIGLVGWLFLAGFLLTLWYQLLVPPIVGLNDNGDFWRMTKSFGMKVAPGESASLVKMARYYEWDGRLFRLKMYPSSQLIPIGIALVLSRIVSKSGMFDIAYLGFVQSVLFGLAFAIVAYALSEWTVRRRAVMFTALVLVFADVGYCAYLNSFYTESATLVSLTFVVAIALLLVMRERTDKANLRLLKWYFAACMLFVCAKLQNAALGFVFAALGFYLSRTLHVADSAFNRSLRRQGALLSAGLVVFSLGYWMAYKFVPGIRSNNVYNMVFNEITRNSDDPEHDLAELGLDKSYMKYYKTFAWTPWVTEEMRQDVLHRVGDQQVLAFYIRHPGRFIELASRGAKSTFVMRCPFLSNFEQPVVMDPTPNMTQVDYHIREYDNLGSGHPYKLPRAFVSRGIALWSDFKEQRVPKNLAMVVLFLLVNLGIVAAKRLKFDRSPRDVMITAIHFVVIAAALIQYPLVLVGEAERDIVKHLFLFNQLCDISVVFVFAYLLALPKLRFPERAA